MSIRTGGQVERLLWAAAEARRQRAEPSKAVARPVYARSVMVIPPEQFTTEWQTVPVAEPSSY